MKSFFPDINVWLALAYRGHYHNTTAAAWFEQVEPGQAAFCRFTQLGFLRLLTHPAVMRDEVKTQREAWSAYDRLSSDARVTFYPETDPQRIEAALRALTATSKFAHQQWPDAYLWHLRTPLV
jgi:toxin-antitoxin system PIN domain toxin